MSDIWWAAIAVWFASGWYLNHKLIAVHEKLDFLAERIARIEQQTRAPEVDPYDWALSEPSVGEGREPETRTMPL